MLCLLRNMIWQRLGFDGKHKTCHMLVKTDKRIRLINERIASHTLVHLQTLANHWQALHNTWLTSALQLNTSNQITEWGTFVLRKMSTCKAFNGRILRIACIRFFPPSRNCCCFMSVWQHLLLHIEEFYAMAWIHSAILMIFHISVKYWGNLWW